MSGVIRAPDVGGPQPAVGGYTGRTHSWDQSANRDWDILSLILLYINMSHIQCQAV